MEAGNHHAAGPGIGIVAYDLPGPQAPPCTDLGKVVYDLDSGHFVLNGIVPPELGPHVGEALLAAEEVVENFFLENPIVGFGWKEHRFQAGGQEFSMKAAVAVGRTNNGWHESHPCELETQFLLN